MTSREENRREIMVLRWAVDEALQGEPPTKCGSLRLVDMAERMKALLYIERDFKRQEKLLDPKKPA